MNTQKDWKPVPVEPTPEMVDAAREHHEGEAYLPVSLYKAMLDAAPTPPATYNDAGYTEGIQAVATMLERKADAYAEEFGYDDMGGLSFGRGREAEAKADYHQSLLELADEVRAMPIAPAPTPPAQDDEAHSAAVSHLWQCLGQWSASIAQGGKLADLAPPSWLIDAINAATLSRQDRCRNWKERNE